ncbi:MAG: flagellar basal-body rod modification protein FlgD [Pseudomonadota bacterium]|jgi:flagellar basal-body rod modification protein FlgD|uniref:Basal-body rod modification protein FlgD n=1 Tax=Pseudaquabacterium rugosum TaxID=2984194 RepID=A0ABU9B6J0_9BURK
MSTTSATSSTSSNPYAYLNGSSTSASSTSSSSSSTSATSAQEQNERFLTLLTAQLQNQDPMNPMDNAQMTSQMAQISTVSSLETVNQSLQSLGSQFVQMQALQGASMVGREVMLEGDRMSVDDAAGTGSGAYELASAASKVELQVLNASGRVVDTVNLGAQSAGRQSFEWDGGDLAPTDAAGYRFNIVATSSSGSTVTATELMYDQVTSVNTSGSALALQTTHSGSVGYSAIKGLH